MTDVVLRWRSFGKFLEAWRTFDHVPCVYIQTDGEKKPIRVGKASKGLGVRYWGGTGYAMAAAMHASGNFIFVAPIPEAMCEEVEKELIWQMHESLPYNTQGKANPPLKRMELKHEGEAPALQ